MNMLLLIHQGNNSSLRGTLTHPKNKANNKEIQKAGDKERHFVIVDAVTLSIRRHVFYVYRWNLQCTLSTRRVLKVEDSGFSAT